MSRIFWFIRAILYRFLWGSVGIGSYIGRPLFIYGARKIHVGKNVRIFPGIRIEVHGNARLTIEDGVGIGQGVHITVGEDLIISSGSTILPYSCITNIVHCYSDPSVNYLKQGIATKKTMIGTNCFVGFSSVILPGAQLGENAIVGANSVVNSSMPPNTICAGSPAEIKKIFDPIAKKWTHL